MKYGKIVKISMKLSKFFKNFMGYLKVLILNTKSIKKYIWATN